MIGETGESGLTVDTLKMLMDERATHLEEMSKLRDQHARDLRATDQMALNLALEGTKEHFERLNENAERTIEERAHFVAVEVFSPFRDQVMEVLAVSRGREKGVGLSANVLVAAVGLVATIIGIVSVLAVLLR